MGVGVGVEDMCSVPPATRVVANPAMIRSAALAIVCRPEEQNRLTVCPGTLSGRPARWAAIRATFIPWLPSVMAQPSSTSSTSAGSSPSARRRDSAMAAPAMSSGRLALRVPRGARPTAVRAPETMTASFTLVHSFDHPADHSIQSWFIRGPKAPPEPPIGPVPSWF